MVALATVADYFDRQPGDPPGDYDTSTQVESALEDASAMIRASLGQIVSLVEDDVITIDGLGLRGLVLPQYPVVEVSDVTLLDSTGDTVLEATDYYVDPDGILWRSTPSAWGWGWGWPRTRGTVQVTYTHGYATMPDEAVTLCCRLAARLLLSSTAGVAVTSRSVTLGVSAYSETFADGSGAINQRGLTAEEDALLRAYPWPVVDEGS